MPYVEKIELRMIYKFLVVASDGLWDSLEDSESIDIIKLKDNASEMTKALISQALAKFSKDNISCLVLRLN